MRSVEFVLRSNGAIQAGRILWPPDAVLLAGERVRLGIDRQIVIVAEQL